MSHSKSLICSTLLLQGLISNVSGFAGFTGRNTQISSPPTTFIPPPSIEDHSFTSSTTLHLKRYGRPKGPLRTFEEKPTMNDEIEYDELRVTTPNAKGKDEPLGIMSKADALAKAKELGGLDLILINKNSDPPVCKIVDYSKWRYMKEKKAKELKKNSKASELKEVKMSYKIDSHDYNVRVKAATKFLMQGNRVKCTVMFKGREIQHDKLGQELLVKLSEDMQDICTMEGRPKREGRNLSAFMSPKAEVIKKVNEKRRAADKAKKRSKQKNREAVAEKKNKAVVAAEAEAAAKAETEVKVSTLLDDDDDDLSLDDLMAGTNDDVTENLFG